MGKFSRIVTAAALATLLATPAFALETSLSGYYNLMAAANNFAASQNYIGSLTDNAPDESVIDQRFRLKLDAKVNDALSFVYYGEIDMQWGDTSYNTSRNEGGGLGGDTVNLETKNVYIDIKIPNDTSAFRLGLQGFADHYDYSFIAADMAGIKYTGNYSNLDLTAGWFKLVDGSFNATNDVNLWALQAEFKPNDSLDLGGDYYFYQNKGAGLSYGTHFGTADLDDLLFLLTPSWTSSREDMSLHYIGAHGEYRLADITFSGWFNFNTGTVDSIDNNFSTPGVLNNLDVSGYAGRLKAAMTLAGIKLNLAGTYFSADDDLSDGDAGFIVNPFPGETFAFGMDGFMIFTPDMAWESVGQYGFAMTDAAYAGYGLTSIILTGDYTPEQMKNVYLKGGVGYFASVEDQLGANDQRLSRDGTSLGTELFLRAGYMFADNLDVSLNGAYAFLGDFYDTWGGGNDAKTTVTDVSDPYMVYLKTTLSF